MMTVAISITCTLGPLFSNSFVHAHTQTGYFRTLMLESLDMWSEIVYLLE